MNSLHATKEVGPAIAREIGMFATSMSIFHDGTGADAPELHDELLELKNRARKVYADALINNS